MINILYPVNKSVQEQLKYFPEFLNRLEHYLKSYDISITYVLFSENLEKGINSKIVINDLEETEVYSSVEDYENDNEVSFREQLYSDLMQTSPYMIKTGNRSWYLPESEFNSSTDYLRKINKISNLIKSANYSFVITDQTPDYEQSVIQSLCVKEGIPFIRYLPNFMIRGFFTLYSTTGKGTIIDVEINPTDKTTVELFTEDYRTSRSANIYTGNEDSVRVFEPHANKSIFNRLTNRSFLRLLESIWLRVKREYFTRIESILKSQYYTDSNLNIKYIYYGLHLTTESHVALHSYPYMNQINVIETISRSLPFGYTLYVKPHPWWLHTIGLKEIKQISKIPSVKILSPKTPIKEIVKRSKGIVTLNATTGVEALVLGKPVIALSEVNSYVKYHPNALLCSNLYKLPTLVNRMTQMKVEHDDTTEYLQKMFSLSSDIRLEAERFLSDKDADHKAIKFARYIKYVIENVKGNNKS